MSIEWSGGGGAEGWGEKNAERFKILRVILYSSNFRFNFK